MLDYTKGAKPLYSQVKKIIKKKILDGYYQVNENIPTEKELQEEFSVSRITIRKALEELTVEGYVGRKRGSGTVVLRQLKIAEEIHHDRSFTEELKAQGIEPGTKSSKIRSVIGSGIIAENLGVGDGTQIIELTRIRTANNVPIAIVQSYINPEYIQVSEKEIEAYESLYALFRDKGTPVSLKSEVFEVSLSTEWNSKLLETPLGTPILKRASVVYYNEQPVMYTETVYNGYMYRYTVRHHTL